MTKTPRYTDRNRYPTPYVPAAESEKVGYLDARFKLYAERAKVNAAEREVKLRKIGRKP